MLKVEINETTAKCVGAGGLDTITCDVALLAFRFTLVSLLTKDSTVWEEQAAPAPAIV